MATVLKQRLRRFNGVDYDTIHLETEASLVTGLGALALKNSLSKSDVGLGNVVNVSTNDQTPTYAVAETLAALVSGEKLNVSMGKLAKAVSDLISHLANTNNPHTVTAAKIGAQPQVTYQEVTLSASGWSNDSQTATVTGVKADGVSQMVIVYPASADEAAYKDAGIRATGQAANSLTFGCNTTPAEDLTVYVAILELEEAA